jgi:hypothetical protein
VTGGPITTIGIAPRDGQRRTCPPPSTRGAAHAKRTPLPHRRAPNTADYDGICRLIGVRADGRKELVALADGYRESISG